MDYKIMEKDGFNVVCKSIQVTIQDGENLRWIPQFWQECHADGSTDNLCAINPGKPLLGICMDMEHDQQRFTYLIAIEATTPDSYDGFTVRSIPASTWAVFSSVGPMPGAIQKVWDRIFQEWFPATGYEHTGGPELEVYPAGDTTADDYQCEIWVPIVKK